ncbi:MAG: transcription-repair coupling factor [Candidatus Heritagella sp.]
MRFFEEALLSQSFYKQLEDAVRAHTLPGAVSGLSSIHKAHLVATLCSRLSTRALLIAGEESEAARLAGDLNAMGCRTLFYPLRDFSLRHTDGSSHEYEHQRLQVLCSLLEEGEEGCRCVVTCADAALQYTLPPEELRRRTITLTPGQRLNPEELCRVLLRCGCERSELTDGPGLFSVRGGIVDFCTPGISSPVRVEFWDDEIDTLSLFDPETQRRTEMLPSIRITPSNEVLIDNKKALSDRIRAHARSLRGKNAPAARAILQQEADRLDEGLPLGSKDKFLPFVYEKPATLFDYMREGDLLVVSEYTRSKERVRASQWQWGEELRAYLEEGVLCRGLDRYSQDWEDLLGHLQENRTLYLDTFLHGSYDTPVRLAVSASVRQLSCWGGSTQLLEEDLQAALHSRESCVVLAGSEKNARIVAADLKAAGLPAAFLSAPAVIPKGTVAVTPGTLSAGFEYPQAGFFLITQGHQSMGAVRSAPRKKRNKNAQEVYSLSELTPGDYVVHATHGIGVFDGIRKLDLQGVVKDYIKIRYAKNDVLYVPVTQLDLVSKYIGPREDSSVRLNRLGGTEWQKAKTRVRKAVQDMAKELTKLYAQRMNAKGHAFSPDSEWQHDFESHFPYEETEDQLRCINEIKDDMERQAPMDRLLCGDVGFGKTEVALRAAFKCVSDSKQCAFLVPTTILAWQHYQTICQRMEGFPVRVELLSRFRTPAQQEEILRKLRRGEVDIIVGTHRLVSKDVQFRDLGLVVIDEEQRFGVAQKEKLKQVCQNVDVLTLSATPIPRTLNMALSGIRDMSVIEEAPHDRHPVQTYVLEHDPQILNEAIRRELRRGGQVFYLHNDVGSIERLAAGLAAMIPEARIGIGHGKMSENELSEVWRRMIDHEIDILVCTTIIETGVDVPNANTLIIDNADRLGLSQLHQIRGRVGRSSRRAYAYFTFTRNKVLSEIAEKRLSAIREFTEFGSGFKIAMRDLEIRGAGNILGGEQHGHMESVGYDMYVKLLNEAISLEKGEKPAPVEGGCLIDLQVQAHIPESYIENLSQRLEIYRRIADIRNYEDAADVIDELIDRFGEPPRSVQGLVDVALLRSMATRAGMTEIKQQQNTLLLYPETVDMQSLSLLVAGMKKGQVLFSAGGRPYFSVRLLGQEPLTVLEQALALLCGESPESEKKG